MRRVNLSSPPLMGDIRSLRNYVFQTVEALNIALENTGAKAVLEEIESKPLA